MIWKPTELPHSVEYETRAVLKKLAGSHRSLAELKGVALTIPKQEILINTLTLQEAKDSSEVENIVTTHDELFKGSLGLDKLVSPATKEVQNYISALKIGFELTSKSGLLTNNIVLKIIGIFISFRWAYAWVEDINNFYIQYIYLWLFIGVCFSEPLRKMNNKEIKKWVVDIFSLKKNVKAAA